MSSSDKQYPSDFRKKLSAKIHKIKKKEDYIQVFKILHRDPNMKFTENTNGIWIDINLVSDKTISKVIDYIQQNIFVYILLLKVRYI